MTQKNITYVNWILVFFWTLLLVLSFGIMRNHIKQTTKGIALSEARAYLNKDLAFRKWVAKLGGLYVPVTKETRPSPYLSNIPNRDIRLVDGNYLTLLNPAYAIRLLNETFAEFYGITGHTTSRQLIRPENAPDEWEKVALQKFTKGSKEVYEVTMMGDEPFFRLMHPMWTKQSCLKCHASQGYKVGDLRGGVTVALSMVLLDDEEQHFLFMLTIVLSSLWIAGLFLILWGGGKFGRAMKERDDALFTMETLFQKSTDGILLIQDHRFTDCNEAAVTLLDFSTKKELLGQHPADISPEFQPDGCSFREKSEELLRLCVEQGNTRFEWLCQRAGGENCWIEVVLTRIDFQGKFVIHAALRDINLLKNSQKELTRYQEQLENMLAERTAHLQETGILLRKSQEIAKIGSWKIDIQANVLTWSEGVYRIFGLTPLEFQPSLETFVAAVHPDDRHMLKQAYLGALRGKNSFDIEYRIVLPDKTIRIVHVKSEEIVGENGRAVSSIGMIEDITEKILAKEELHRLVDEAQAANKAKSVFLANMSHEIRTPLNAMIGFSELALETSLTDKQRGYLSTIHSASHNLLHILNDILDYSRIEASRLELEECSFVLSEVIKSVESLFLSQANDKGIELRVYIEGDIHPYLLGDPLRLRQILVNLVGNALKFTHKGTVALEVSLQSHTAEQVRLKFSVLDSGIGIPGDKLTILCQPFSQVDVSHTRKYGGTGLGLAISKKLVEMMEGHLEIRSKEGKGSEFFFVLDFIKATSEDLSSDDLLKFPEKRKRETVRQIDGGSILLVEDNFINQQVAVKSDLPERLPGLDIHEGIARLAGNTEMYLRLLAVFMNENSGKIPELKESIQSQITKSVRRRIHSIKGTAGNLCAVSLAQAASDLEDAYEEERDTTVPFDLFERRFEELIDSIGTLLSKQEKKTGSTFVADSYDYQRLLPLVEKLTAMLRKNHFNATTKWAELKPLFHKDESEVVGKIDKYICMFEFDPAEKLLVDLLDRLQMNQ